MSPHPELVEITRLTLEAIKSSRGDCDLGSLFMSAPSKYKKNGTGSVDATEIKRAVLRCLNELLRSGIIGIGTQRTGDWHTGFCYLTEHGKSTADQISRDPINRSGYLVYLEQHGPLDATTRSYVEEALDTYSNCCYRATAVLIGAAVENLVLDLRDELTDRLHNRGETISKELSGWVVKQIVEAIADRILPDLRSAGKSDDNIRKLKEDAESRLSPIAAEFRRLRNNAGHPAALAPVLPADAHANLLLFPSTVKLLRQLKTWVAKFYV